MHCSLLVALGGHGPQALGPRLPGLLGGPLWVGAVSWIAAFLGVPGHKLATPGRSVLVTEITTARPKKRAPATPTGVCDLPLVADDRGAKVGLAGFPLPPIDAISTAAQHGRHAIPINTAVGQNCYVRRPDLARSRLTALTATRGASCLLRDDGQPQHGEILATARAAPQDALDCRRVAARALRIPRALPRPVSTRPVESKLARDVRTLIDSATNRIRAAVLENPRWSSVAGTIRSQLGLDSTREDQSEVERFTEAMEEIKIEFLRDQPESILRDMLERYGREVNARNLETFRRQFKAAIGVDAVANAPNGEAMLGQYVADNVNLIKTLQADKFGKVRDIVTRGWRVGDRWDDIADRIQDEFDLNRFQSVRIARDQVGKLNGQFTRDRSLAVGVERFVWRTSKDGRVRAKHRELEGRIYDFDGGHPTEGIPGQPILCRCHAEPIFDDIQATTES